MRVLAEIGDVAHLTFRNIREDMVQHLILFLTINELPLETRLRIVHGREEGNDILVRLSILLFETGGLDGGNLVQIDRGEILVTNEEHDLILLKIVGNLNYII